MKELEQHASDSGVGIDELTRKLGSVIKGRKINILNRNDKLTPIFKLKIFNKQKVVFQYLNLLSYSLWFNHSRTTLRTTTSSLLIV